MISVVKVPAELIPCDKWSVYENAPLPQDSNRCHTIVIVCCVSSKIKYFYVTSQVEKALKLRYKYDKFALVEIQKSEWAEVLTKDVSCIQCGKNHLKCIDIVEFKKLYANNATTSMDYIGKIPEDIKQKIKIAINASVTYSPAEQSELTCDSDKTC